MNKKKIGMRIMSVVFIAMLFVPSVLWLFLGEMWGGENSEKRMLASKPELSIQNIESYPSLYETYYNDHLPFRNALITLNSRIQKNVYMTSSVDKVQYGKDGWFFYMNNIDGETLSIWRGDNLLSEEQMAKIAENLIQTRDQLRMRGTEFILFIGPNKERIYSEFVPDYMGEMAEPNVTEQLVAYLRENTDIPIIFPAEELLAAKEQFPDIELYYKTDTHWNDVGAYIGTRLLLQEMGIETPALTEEMISKVSLIQGDLAMMLNLPDEKYMCQAYSVIDEARPYLTTYKDEDSIIESTSSLSSAKTMLARRDSFFTAMIPYCLPYVSQAWLPHGSVYTPEMIDQADPDYFVFEVVERHLVQALSEPLYISFELTETDAPTAPVEPQNAFPPIYFDLCNNELVVDYTINYQPDTASYTLKGWSVDAFAEKSASEILVQIGDKFYAVEYGAARPDVAEFYGVAAYEASGFTLTIPASYLEDVDEISFHIIAADGSYRYAPSVITILR